VLLRSLPVRELIIGECLAREDFARVHCLRHLEQLTIVDPGSYNPARYCPASVRTLELHNFEILPRQFADTLGTLRLINSALDTPNCCEACRKIWRSSPAGDRVAPGRGGLPKAIPLAVPRSAGLAALRLPGGFRELARGRSHAVYAVQAVRHGGGGANLSSCASRPGRVHVRHPGHSSGAPHTDALPVLNGACVFVSRMLVSQFSVTGSPDAHV
jgi:hypothetical protein